MDEKQLAQLVNRKLQEYAGKLLPSEIQQLRNDFWEIANATREAEMDSWIDAIKQAASDGTIRKIR